jgi:hypothetical protein
MRYCPHCRTVNGNELRWCQSCGASIIHEPTLTPAGSFHNDFFKRYGAALHRRHRWLNLQIALAISTAIHVVAFGGVMGVGGWALAYVIATGIGATLLIHKVRLGHLSTICLLGFVDLLGLGLCGSFAGYGFIAFMFVFWLLSFWYAFLGYQLTMNNDLHT